jgi:hypothetical protein
VKFSTSLVRFGSVGDVALELRKALTAIAAGWNVEHNPDGTHKASVTAGLPTAHHTTHEHGGSDEVAFTTGIIERGRSVAMGEWTNFTPTLTASAGTVTINANVTCRYTLIGKTMILTFYLVITLSATPISLTLTLPGGVTAANATVNAMLDITGTALLFQTPSTGATTALLYRNGSGGSGVWPTGGNTIGGTITFPIQ